MKQGHGPCSMPIAPSSDPVSTHPERKPQAINHTLPDPVLEEKLAEAIDNRDRANPFEYG